MSNVFLFSTGDIAVFDNIRVLHGRRSYNSASGRR
ncbi:TauD/TfdA family dioxygenase, partial [Acinetobacter baumannii]